MDDGDGEMRCIDSVHGQYIDSAWVPCAGMVQDDAVVIVGQGVNPWPWECVRWIGDMGEWRRKA